MTTQQDQQPDQQRCSEKVANNERWVNVFPCRRKGVVEEDGKWWCKQHSPSAKKARREARSAKYQTGRDVQVARWNREAAVMKACEGVATEDLRPGMVAELVEQQGRLLTALEKLTGCFSTNMLNVNDNREIWRDTLAVITAVKGEEGQ